MLDRFYENIGGKLKNLAKVALIVEAIAAVTGGFLLFAEDEWLYGSLSLFLGPIVAWVSSWMLYAFGELVESSASNEETTAAILSFLKQQGTPAKTVPVTAPVIKAAPAPGVEPAVTVAAAPKADDLKAGSAADKTTTFSDVNTDTIRCDICNFDQPRDRKVCWHCGATFLNKEPVIAHRWLCDGCGQMRSQTPCEHCEKE